MEFSPFRSHNYYDPAVGWNPFEFYFEPIRPQGSASAAVSAVSSAYASATSANATSSAASAASSAASAVSSTATSASPPPPPLRSASPLRVYELGETQTDADYIRRFGRASDGQFLSIHNGARWAVRAYYYGEPASTQRRSLDTYDETWYARHRRVAARVFSEYYRVKPEVKQHVETLWRAHVPTDASAVLGMHIRGTDKGGKWRHGIDDLSAYLPYLLAFLSSYPSGCILLATDDPIIASRLLSARTEGGTKQAASAASSASTTTSSSSSSSAAAATAAAASAAPSSSPSTWPHHVREAVVMPQPIASSRNLRGGMRVSPCYAAKPCGKREAGLAVLTDILLLSRSDFLVHGESAGQYPAACYPAACYPTACMARAQVRTECAGGGTILSLSLWLPDWPWRLAPTC